MYPQVFGKYVLERELSRGGMARVLLATLRGAGGFEKRLVVKQIREELALDQEFVRRFVDEAKTTVALSHPNIVPVYELGVELGVYFLAMELVEGASVAELIRGDGNERLPLTPEEGAHLGAEICRALDYAHRRMQVVHRDITPRNVMVDDEGQVKLIDFGIAARARAEVEVFGSPGHMPPEQMHGESIGPPTDLFAVAVLLMEAWSGKAPFRRETAEASEAAMRAKHPAPSEIDPRLGPLDDIVGRAMALDPNERPQDADELGRALRRFVQGFDAGDVARSLGERARAARKRENARAAAREEKKRASGGLFVPTPGMPMITRTFAARDEVTKIETGAAPSTRKIAESTPPPPADHIETIATRPLETPTRPKRDEAAGESPRFRAWPLALVAMAALGGGIAWLRGQSAAAPSESTASPPRHTSDAPSAAASAAPSTSSPLAASSPVATPPAPPPAGATHAPDPASSAAAKPGGSTSGSTNATTKGRLSLFGDPGTRVSVDGTDRGACPVRDLALEPGPHDVRFVFDPTGESRGERVTVPSAGSLTVRADFTGAAPTLRVEHPTH